MNETAAVPDLEEIYREHGQRVAAWIVRLGGPSVEVEDLVQEVFLVVQRQLPGFRGEAKISTWLFRITTRLVLHRLRSDRRRRWLRGFFEAESDHTRPSVTTPAQHLEQRESAATVYRILDQLGEKYRTPLVLFELEGLSGEEIAEVLSIPVKLVWVRLHRGRAQFLSCLQQSERVEAKPKAVKLSTQHVTARLTALRAFSADSMGEDE